MLYTAILVRQIQKKERFVWLALMEGVRVCHSLFDKISMQAFYIRNIPNYDEYQADKGDLESL